jgi:hypothetical protein
MSGLLPTATVADTAADTALVAVSMTDTVPFCSEATALRLERGGLNFACEDLHFHIGARGCGGGFMP